MTAALLVVNAGSSSLKFALHDSADGRRLARGEVERIGSAAQLATTLASATTQRRDVQAESIAAALDVVLAWIEQNLPGVKIVAVGHRIVHGGTRYRQPVVLDDAVLGALESLDPLAPQHQPFNLAAARALRKRFPGALPVGCFDTAFHAGWHDSAQRIPLPRRFHDAGVRRYGFHGLSYEYLTARMRTLAPAASRIVLAHLGSGASICAVRDGASVECTMGFSVLDGLPMATRCGQIDPGVIFHLHRQYGLDFDAIEHLLFNDCGLKGMSGVSNDMRALLADAGVEARQAIGVFEHRCAQAIGAMAATLGGIDALVFSGGMGAHAAPVRAGICAPLKFLGVELDELANARGSECVSSARAVVPVYALATDEEAVIAESTLSLWRGAGADHATASR